MIYNFNSCDDFNLARSMLSTVARTDLLIQAGLDNAGVNLDLPVKNPGEVTHGANGGTRNAKEAPVEDFDLSFGNSQSFYEPAGQGGGITLSSIFFVDAGSAKKS